MRFTKGPWHLEPEPYRYFWRITANYTLVGSAPFGSVKSKQEKLDELKANAHLIAAAPELYEALERVVRISDRDHVAWNEAKAALAKARGET